MDTLDMPETGPLKMFDVDNAMALEDWRASGLGPCAAMLFERQILGEFPHAEEVCVYRAQSCLLVFATENIAFPVTPPPMQCFLLCFLRIITGAYTTPRLKVLHRHKRITPACCTIHASGACFFGVCVVCGDTENTLRVASAFVVAGGL